MDRALELAERGWGRVAPNPLVGAVVAREDRVVGEGHHAEWGGPHAEVQALAEAGPDSRGATLYVNLEPCHHWGKTGPCSEAIFEAGIARLVCAVAETNPEARGASEWLRSRGVKVDIGVRGREAWDLNAPHLTAPDRKRPFLALKYAMSLDGRLSREPGRPSRVTTGEAIVEAHRLRAGHEAVLVGIGTVLADDPALTVREWREPRVPPTRVVADSRLRIPLESRLVEGAGGAPVRVITADDAPVRRIELLRARGVEVATVPRCEASGRLDLGKVLTSLRAEGVDSVLCEGGGELGSALLAANLVDRLYAFIAPTVFGSPGTLAFQGDLGGAREDWRMIERKALGEVTLLILGPELTDDAVEDVPAS